jgi:hypothetical protein
MKASDIPIGTKVEWPVSSSSFSRGNVVANDLRAGHLIVLIERDMDFVIVMKNVLDVKCVK